MEHITPAERDAQATEVTETHPGSKDSASAFEIEANNVGILADSVPETSINDLDEIYRANTILYRLARALGYEMHNGVIIANPEEVVQEATAAIEHWMSGDVNRDLK